MSEVGPGLWTALPQSPPAPCDRYKHACCSYDGHVFLLGGRQNRSLRDFWKYSVVYDDWTELSCVGEAAPEELEEHTMVAHQGFLYVFGGMLDSAYSGCRCAFWVFDIAKEKWIHCRRKTSSSQRTTPTNRKKHSAVVLGSEMVVYGGFVDIKGSSDEMWRLDFDTMAWSLLSDGVKEPSGPGPRHGHSAAAHQGCMYLFGGLKGLREQNDLWRWTSGSNTWTSLRNKSGPPRLMGHSAVSYRGGMLLFGGGRCQSAPNNCLWRYSFAAQTWSQVATPAGSAPPAKIHHCCVGLGEGYGPGGPPELPPDCTHRPFQKKCFPAQLSFLGSEGAIELQTFRDASQLAPPGPPGPPGPEPLRRREVLWTPNCTILENKGFRRSWSYGGDQDISQYLPDLLLLLGGRPCSRPSPLAVWQLTFCDS